MKKFFVALAIVLSLVMAGQSYAIDEVADNVKAQTGSGSFFVGPVGLLGISIRGATTGDNVGIYDYGDTSHRSGNGVVPGDIRDIEFELGITANNGSAFIDAKGAPFRYGIYIQASVSTILTSITYDY